MSESAPARLVADAESLAHAMNMVPDLVFIKDPGGHVIYANQAFYDQVAESGRSCGKKASAFLARAQARLAAATDRKVLEEQCTTSIEFELPATDDRPVRLLEIVKSPLMEDDDVVAIVGVGRDITELKRAAARNQLLLNELDHRVRNVLASISGVIDDAFRRYDDPAAIRQCALSQVDAMHRAYNLLHHRGAGRASMADLVRSLLLAGRIDSSRLSTDGPECDLDPALYVPLALVLNELITNALKHGAFASVEGTLDVRWRVGESADLTLEWTEHRDGDASGPPVSTGRGLSLTRSLIEGQMHGTFDYAIEPSGFRATVTIPNVD